MQQLEKYRKPDQYYIDEYDRITIEAMKALENEMLVAEKLFSIDPNDLKSPLNDTTYLGYRIRYVDTGANYDRNKRCAIDERIRVDEWKDRVVKSQVVPQQVHCLLCGTEMDFEFFDFIEKDNTFLMWFSCPDHHAPRRAFYKNGEEYRPQEARCADCGGAVSSMTKRTKKKLIITDTCRECKKKMVMEFELTKKTIMPIDEADRKKYCTDFIGRNNFEEDIRAIASLSELIDDADAKEKYEFRNIQKLNIAQLEEMLATAIENSGFIKMQFDKPKISRYLTVGFSVQDTLDRESAKSIKAMKKLTETTLFPTNWRLMSPGFEYRLGYLSGQLKGFSLDEDLLKIAQEIWERKRVKS